MTTPLPGTPGIYQIRDVETKKVYVGSTVSLKARQKEHWRRLSRGTHENSYLQNAWNKRGSDAFVFEVLENIDVEGAEKLKPRLLLREQHHIDIKRSANRDFGYNIEPTAGSSLGSKRTPAQIKANRARQRGKLMGPHRYNAKLTFEQADEIRNRYATENVSCADLAKDFDITRGMIHKVIKGKTYNEGYKKPPIKRPRVVARQIKNNKITCAARGRSPLSYDDVKRIRGLWSTKRYTQKQIAQVFNVSRSAVSNIVIFNTWKTPLMEAK